MSDFDEEAERERLREKYEKDEERRKETQQMSELLLKGATMTNQHCGECGSPIFRYQGQEFCPSCQRVTGEEAASGNETAESSPESPPSAAADAAGRSESNGAVERDSTAAGSAETDDRESGRSVAPGPEPDSEPEPNAAAAGEAGVSPKPEATSGRSVDSGGTPGGHPTDSGGTPRRPSADVGKTPSAADEESAASEQTARDALLRALTRHAQLAEGTDDPRQAKAHLAAAREAAEALDELE